MIYVLGGGANLNFSVKAYASESALPTTAEENEIAVITSTAITDFIFTKANGPVVNGRVLFFYDLSSSVYFNALKKNYLWVYLGNCKQYINNALVNLDAFIYKSGAWTQFSSSWNGELYNAGNEYTSITGGWAAKAMDAGSGASTYLPTITRNTSNIVFTASGGNNGGAVYLANKIDLTNYSTLRFEVTVSGAGGQFDIWTTISSSLATNRVSATPVSTNMSVDISSINGLHNLGFYLAANNGTAATITLKKMWME